MKKLTQEQKQKAVERRQKLRTIAASISKMSPEQRAALVRDWPRTIEGHQLSLHNACMIALQGGASVVGGFNQWKRAGRSVIKGQHGFGIWIPLGVRKTDRDESSAAVMDDPQGFGIATVFDISQTEEIKSPAMSDNGIETLGRISQVFAERDESLGVREAVTA